MSTCEHAHHLQADGSLHHADNTVCIALEVPDTLISVPHLDDRVVSYQLPKGDTIKVLISFACHCWTDGYDAQIHGEDCLKIMDHKRPRAFSKERYDQSILLPIFITQLQQHRCLLTPAERNYVAYNASVVVDETRTYRVFFTVRQDRGRFDGVRHSLRLTVESAYLTDDPLVGSKVAFDYVIGSVLRGEKAKYRR